jgi:hypothetical protein
MKWVLVAVIVLTLACDLQPVPPRNPPARHDVPPAAVAPESIYDVGGEVSAPTVIKRVDPQFPQDDRAHVLGILIIRGVVRRDGTVGDVTIVKGPDNRYSRAVITALRQWIFAPAKLRGKPVDANYMVSVNHMPQGPDA